MILETLIVSSEVESFYESLTKQKLIDFDFDISFSGCSGAKNPQTDFRRKEILIYLNIASRIYD